MYPVKIYKLYTEDFLFTAKDIKESIRKHDTGIE